MEKIGATPGKSRRDGDASWGGGLGTCHASGNAENPGHLPDRPALKKKQAFVVAGPSAIHRRIAVGHEMPQKKQGDVVAFHRCGPIGRKTGACEGDVLTSWKGASSGAGAAIIRMAGVVAVRLENVFCESSIGRHDEVGQFTVAAGNATQNTSKCKRKFRRRIPPTALVLQGRPSQWSSGKTSLRFNQSAIAVR